MSGFTTAASAAQSGDTIEVQSGTYDGVDVKWFANNLTIEAVGGPVMINDSGYTIGNQKGIFDVVGNNATVQGITFENAHDLTGQSKNYAGIRDDGEGLTVNQCTFTGNDDGILATPPAIGAGSVLVEYSVFSNNGYGDGYSHNMYIGHVSAFTLEYSSTTDANQGHDVKSRAYNTYLLYNSIGDSSSGSNDNASLIDLPDGGNSYLIGNEIHKGSNSGNGTIIDENVEGISDGAENPTQELVMVNNTVVNDRSSGTYVLAAGSQTAPVNLTNNLFAGLGENGTTLYLPQSGAPATVVSQSNLTISNPGFVDEATGNYQLLSTSPAIDAGTNPGTANGFNLTPTNEYVATANTETRPTEGTLDIGAFEFVPTGQQQTPTVAMAAVASPPTVTGTTAALSVLGSDAGGASTLTYTWAETSGPAAVSFSVNGSNAAQNTTVTFSEAGDYTFTATITNEAGLTVTSTTGTVVVRQTPTLVTLNPATATVIDGATQQFTASVNDQFGNAIANPDVTWSSSGPGRISTTGLYTAPATGTSIAMVTATDGTASDTETIQDQMVVPTPTPTVPPVPIVQPTVPLIIGEQALFTRKTKHGKSIGRPILDGYSLEFNTPLVAANATDLANYQLGTIKIKKVHKRSTTIFAPMIGVSVAYASANDSVSLKFTGKQTFKTGGELVVEGGAPSGIESSSGGYLVANAVLMISRGGKSIGPA